MTQPTLLPLITRLKACPAREASLTRERLLEGWEALRREEVAPLGQPPIPILAALVLQDDRFARLLNEAELAQLRTLVNRALDRYEQEINPPNKLGKLIAGSLPKESQ